jgi:anti-sigma factor ChrR (cupin superfamily)
MHGTKIPNRDRYRPPTRPPADRTIENVNADILAQPGYQSASIDATAAEEILPGIRVRRLWSGVSAKAAVLEMDPGSSFPERDVHEPGPEEVYVLDGVFNDGARDYPAGTFLHAPAGSWHLPSTTTGCRLFLFYPEG